MVRPLQERLGSKRSLSAIDSTSYCTRGSPARAVFLEVEEETGRPVTVMRPLPSNNNSPLASGGAKRRSVRLRVPPHQYHRRSWSVGGSNVHQTMMRRSESHLRRLEHISESKDQMDKGSRSSTSSSSSSSCPSPSRRCSALVDAETQTISEQTPVVPRRSKGDGLSVEDHHESPVLTNFRRTVDSTENSSEDDEVLEEEDEEESYEWDRKRGRASGSSQRLSLCESSTYSLNPATIDHLKHSTIGGGRRYTVDMSQWKYNETWAKENLSTNQQQSADKGIIHFYYLLTFNL